MKILIVDDKEENRYFLESLLKGFGYEVTSAVNGKDALEKLRKDSFNMIISDILMPEMDGFQFLENVKNDNNLKNIPFVFYTATYTSDKDKEFGLKLGANKYIQKPIDPEEFIKIIQNIIRDFESGELKPIKPAIEKDEEILKLYSERLVKKLEEKMLDLEREITERKQSEKKIKHLNQVLHAIRNVNQLITKEKDRDRLIKKSCENLVETRGYFNAWIVLLDDSGKYLTSAESGLGKDFLPIIELMKSGKIIACGKNALKKSDIVIIENPTDVCKDCMLSRKYAGRGAMTIRLEYEGKIYGFTSVSIPQELIKYEEEHNLLKEVAEDIAFALHSIEVEKEHKRAEQIQKVLYNISNAVSITDNLEELISRIQEKVGTIIDTTNFYIALYDHKTDTISLPFYTDEKDNIASFPVGKTLTYYVIKTQKPLLATKERIKKLEKSGDVESFGANSEIWLGVPLKIEGKVTGVLAVQSYTDENAYNESDMKMLEFVSDQISISIERKKAEQNLINAFEKATESDRLKTAFLNNISHELRTPLNAVIGFSDIIDKDTSIDEILDYSKIINNSGIHLLRIIEDIFDITMIESGEVEIQKEEFNLTVFMDDIHKKLKAEQELTEKQNIDIYFNPAEKAKDFLVYTDHSKLKRILINLLKNALKFTHEGNIEYGYVKETQQEDPVLKFYVKDTGIGISENKLDIIFKIFRQADDTDTRLYGGTGIGLSVSKKLTELLGGKIWVETEEGNLPAGKAGGSTFYFTIPYRKAEII